MPFQFRELRDFDETRPDERSRERYWRWLRLGGALAWFLMLALIALTVWVIWR